MERHQRDDKSAVAILSSGFEQCLETLNTLFEGKPFRLPEGRMSRPLYDALMVSHSLQPQPELLAHRESVRTALQQSLNMPEDYAILIGRGNTVEAIKSRVELAGKILSAR